MMGADLRSKPLAAEKIVSSWVQPGWVNFHQEPGGDTARRAHPN